MKKSSLHWIHWIDWIDWVAGDELIMFNLKRDEPFLGFHFLLQGIFLTQESNPGLLRFRQSLYRLSYERSLHNSEYRV